MPQAQASPADRALLLQLLRRPPGTCKTCAACAYDAGATHGECGNLASPAWAANWEVDLLAVCDLWEERDADA
jgi:hypothetical protein